jgi:hypothetical protein
LVLALFDYGFYTVLISTEKREENIMPNAVTKQVNKLTNDVEFYRDCLDIATELLDDRQLKEYIELTKNI